MIYNIDDVDYKVIVERKKNKNSYITINDNLEIIVRTNIFTTNNKIIKLLDSNREWLKKTMSKRVKQNKKREEFYYLGNNYDIIMVPTLEKNRVEIEKNKLYVKDEKSLLKWLKNQMMEVFETRLKYNYSLFKEDIPFPNLRIRTMKTRWGVCNRKTNTITLNALLIRESMDKIDYVIIHELSHFLHFNHSKSFWECVNKYCPNYKVIRKDMRS